MQIGFIGTGVMGDLMARCLLEAGHELAVYDRRPEATADLCDKGARWADGPRSIAAGSQVVFTSLPGPTEVEQVVFDPLNGILAGIRPGSCYIDTTTSSSTLMRKVAHACLERGIEVLDAPVSGRPPQMTVMVGGDAATFAKYRPLLATMGRNIFHVGEAGMGMVAKAVNQFMICAGLLVGAEGLLLGARGGIDVQTLYEVLAATGSGGTLVHVDPYLSKAFKAVFQGDFQTGSAPGGPLDRWIKDLGCASEVAKETGAQFFILSLVEDVLRRAQAQGWGEQVWYGAVRILEQMAAVELRTQRTDG